MEMGICPKCDSDNLDYGVFELVANGIKYPVVCEDCDFEGYEWLNCTFDCYTDLKGNDMETKTKMTVKEALELIVENSNCPALNYAVNYAVFAMNLLYDSGAESHEFKVQLLYILSNIGKWRYNKNFSATAAQIKECRAVLKMACK